MAPIHLAGLLRHGVLNNLIPFSLITWGQTHIASGLAAILNATTPLATVLVAHVLTRDERMTAAKFAGVMIGLVGVAIMMGPSALAGLSGDLLAQCAVLVAAVSYALASIFGRRFTAMGLTPLVTSAGVLTASTLMLLPLALVVERPWTLPVPGMATIGAMVGIAVLSTALAYLLYFRLLAQAGATNLVLVTFLIPISAIALGALVLGESLTLRHYLGMLIIGCGLAAIDGRVFGLFRGRLSSRTP